MWQSTIPPPSEPSSFNNFCLFHLFCHPNYISSSLTEPPVPAAPVATTTTAAPSSDNSNGTTTTAAGGQPATTTTTAPPAGGRRRKRSSGSDPASYTSETVGPANVTTYKKLNVFEVTDKSHTVHEKCLSLGYVLGP